MLARGSPYLSTNPIYPYLSLVNEVIKESLVYKPTSQTKYYFKETYELKPSQNVSFLPLF